MTDDPPTQQILLVHGAWHGAWSWAGLQYELDRLGVPSHAIDLPGHGANADPLGDVRDDADAVVAALNALGPGTTLVGHSYGGAVITQAAALSDNVAHLVYIAAFALDDGESVNGFLRAAPRHAVELASVMRPDPEGTATYLDPEAAGDLLYPGVSAVQQQSMVARLSAQTISSMTTPISGSPRSTIPSTYIRCSRDRSVHPEHQRILAERCDNIIEVDTDHSPFIDDPARIADLLAGIHLQR
jgi:pimeloyl-ACP methyl ester carboxylesterase